jgi:hypothetical protein
VRSDRINAALLLEAMRQNEMGFMIVCLRALKIKYLDMPSLPWLTPAGMLKLYYYADQYDTHMLRWRCQENEELQPPHADHKAVYTVAGGEVRNFRFEWYMLELGHYYSGHRVDRVFDKPRLRLERYHSTGKLVWGTLETQFVTIVESLK